MQTPLTPAIEKNIPIPQSNAGRPLKYPFRAMEIGDSFFTPSDNPAKMQRQITSSARAYRPKKFKTAQVEGGVRVWRIA